VASRYHRFAMTALAVAGTPGFAASDVELLSDGPSFTADTLDRLHDDGLSRTQIFFITGADAFAEIGTWHRFPEVLDLANFVVVSRPGHDAGAVVASIPQVAARLAAPGEAASTGPRVYAVRAPTPDVSSTDVRQRLRRGGTVSGLLTPSVEQHIRRHGLYAADATVAPLSPPTADHLHGQD
jgi:nicotinate-nucleotide adenylyltransferase